MNKIEIVEIDFFLRDMGQRYEVGFFFFKCPNRDFCLMKAKLK